MHLERIALQTGGELVAYVADAQIGYGVYRDKPAMIICPGGAYLVLSTRESEPIALEFLVRGFSCFVLRYATGVDREHPDRPINDQVPYPTQVLELMEALHVVREHASTWHIDAQRLYVTGFSAGGHVAATLATRWNDAELLAHLPFAPNQDGLKPTGVLLGYPMLCCNDEAFFQRHETAPDVIRQTRAMYRVLFWTSCPSVEEQATIDVRRYVSSDAAPLFIWNCVDDPVVDPWPASDLVRALADEGVSCEWHLMSRGGHGRPLSNGLTLREDERCDPGLAGWVDSAMSWMETIEGACDAYE